MLAQMPMILKVTSGMERPSPRNNNTSSSSSNKGHHHPLPYPHPNQLLQPSPVPQHNEDTANLLHFIDMASSNIKLALDRPSKSKRKVNHRKYLQKQLKRCGDSPSKGDGSSSSPTGDSHGHHGGLSASAAKSYRKEVSQIGLQIKSLQALFDPRTLQHGDRRGKGGGGAGISSGSINRGGGIGGASAVSSASKQTAAVGQKASLRNRNLPASFFVEPALRACDRPGMDRDIVLSAAVTAGALSPHFATPTVRQAHPHNNAMVNGGVEPVAPNGYPALPSDTLESILGHADLNELLSGQTWYHYQQQQQQQQHHPHQHPQHQLRDTNLTPQREGSVGTCSPRSISDTSDINCAPSPGPSSSSSTSSSTRSPSWSPGFPSQPGGGGGQFASPVLVPRHDDVAVSERSAQQYYLPPGLGQVPAVDCQLQQHGQGQFDTQQYQHHISSHSHYQQQQQHPGPQQDQQQQQQQGTRHRPSSLVMTRPPLGQQFIPQQNLHRQTPPASCSSSSSSSSSSPPSQLCLAPGFRGDFDPEPSSLYYNGNPPQHQRYQQQPHQQLPQQQLPQQQQQQQLHDLQHEDQSRKNFTELPAFSQTFTSDVGLQLNYSTPGEEVVDDSPASGWPSIHPHNYSDYLC